MKKVMLAILEPTTATLVIAFAIGLGIAMHPVFFLVALLVATAGLVEAVVNVTAHLRHRHP